jgi:predicted nucleic acid-binding protein
MAVGFILVDTSVLSEARKMIDQLNDDIVFFLRQVPPGALAVPSAVIFELQRGASMVALTKPERGRAYQDWLDRLLETDIWLPPADVRVRRLLAEMTVVPELSRFWLDRSKEPKLRFGCDPEIAATAIIYGIPLASTDVTDFLAIHRHFPLPGLYCPLGGKWHVPPPADWCLGESLARSERDWRTVIGPLASERKHTKADDDAAELLMP